MIVAVNRARTKITSKTLRWCGLLLLVALSGSWYCVAFFTSYGERLERNSLMVTASTAAASFDAVEIAALEGNKHDLDAHAFRPFEVLVKAAVAQNRLRAKKA